MSNTPTALRRPSPTTTPDGVTGAGLDLLRALGWLVLHDVVLPTTTPTIDLSATQTITFDHVLAGPAGVFLVASAHGHGNVVITQQDVCWGDASYGRVMGEMTWAARILRGRLQGAAVTPVLCLETYQDRERMCDQVLVCTAENVLPLLSETPAVPGAAAPAEVSRMVTRYDRALRYAARPQRAYPQQRRSDATSPQ